MTPTLTLTEAVVILNREQHRDRSNWQVSASDVEAISHRNDDKGFYTRLRIYIEDAIDIAQWYQQRGQVAALTTELDTARGEVDLLRGREQLAIEMCALATEPKLQARKLEVEVARLRRALENVKATPDEAAREAFADTTVYDKRLVPTAPDLDAIEALRETALIGPLDSIKRILAERTLVATDIPALLAEVRRLRQEPVATWQPIETAPKDMTLVLACMNDGSMGVMYAKVTDYHGATPTHWMPLPAEPAPKQEQSG